MAREADLELWEIDIDQSSVPGHQEAWTLAGYIWDPVGLVATRKSGLAEARQMHGSSINPQHNTTPTNNINPSINPSEDIDSGDLDQQREEPDMELEVRDWGPSAPVYQPQPAGSKLLICQVAGCGASLEGMKGYFLRHRVCEEHSKAPVLLIGNVPSRLCQQCSKFHHVSAFEANKRTCRMQLDRIRINKRIRRNRKLNAAASAALAAAAGFQDEGEGALLGAEMPSRFASAFGGGGGRGRAKRPADSSGSGDGSWIYSRKSSRHGGAGAGAARVARGASDGIVGGSDVAAVAAAAAVNPLIADQEPLPESGASETGSREHPRASMGLSGLMRWTPSGTLSSAPQPPRSPPSVPVLEIAVHTVAGGGFGEAGSGYGSGAAQAYSPSSAVTGGSGSAGAVVDVSGMQQQHSGISYSRQRQQQHQQHQHQQHQPGCHNPEQRVARLDSLPVSAAEVGGPGSIAAAAVAAGLVTESSLTAPLQNQVAAAGAPPHGQGRGQPLSPGSPTDRFAAPRLDYHVTAAAGCLQQPPQPRSGQDSAGGNKGPLASPDGRTMPPWETTASMTMLPEGVAAAEAAAGGTVKRQQSLPDSGGSGVATGTDMPPSAAVLHPLLQQQLQHELLLQQHHYHRNHLAQHQQQQPNLGQVMQAPTLAGSAQQQQQQRLCLQQQQLLLLRQQQQAAANPRGFVPLEAPTQQLPGGSGEAALLATDAADAATTIVHPQAAELPAAQVAADTQLSGPSNLSGRSGADGSHVRRSASQCGGGGSGSGGGAATTAAGTSIPSGGTNVLSSSKLIRMSLENDDALDESGTLLLGSLIGLLQTQAAEPRDSATDPRGTWSANPCRRAPSTFSENDSYSRGNGTNLGMPAAAAAATSNGLGGGVAVGGGGLTVALADLSSTAELARAGSGAIGATQDAAMLTATAAAGGCTAAPRLGSLEPLRVGVNDLPGAALAAGRAGGGTLAAAAADAGSGGGTMMVPVACVPGAQAAAGGGPGLGNHRMMNSGIGVGGLAGPTALSTQGLQEQSLLRAPPVGGHPLVSASDLLLQQQLLLAQQQQQLQLQLLQQQQLLRLQQARMPGALISNGGGAAAAAVAAAPPSVPAAGLLLSRLLDADTKTHHLSTELNGCLAEKQLLRRQLLATLSTCQATDAGPLAATAGGGNAAAAAMSAAAAPPLPPALQAAAAATVSLPGLGSQLSFHRPVLGGHAGAGLGLGGVPAGLPPTCGLGSFPGLAVGTAGPATLMDATAGAPGSMGLLPGAMAGLPSAAAAAAGLDMQPPVYPFGVSMGGVGGGIVAAAGAMTGPMMVLGGPSVGGGLLGAGRPSAASQLQALAEARAAAVAAASGAVILQPGGGGGAAFGGPAVVPAAAAAGGGGSGAPAASNYPASDLLTRVSLKIMNCLPDELPSDIRSRMQAFASQAPVELVQGCLRPGCTELVLDALHDVREETRLVSELLRGGDADAAAAALLAALPRGLHVKDIYLQAADQILCVRPGAAPRLASWRGACIRRGGLPMPVLLGAASLVMHVDAADMEACVRIRVYGKHLTDPRVTLLARMAGLALEVKVKPLDVGAAVTAIPTSVTAATTTATAASETPDGNPVPTAATPQQPCEDAAAAAAAAAAVISSSAASAFALPSPPREAAAAVAASRDVYDIYDVEVHLPYNAPPQGLLILEPRAGVLLGDWAPVLLLEDVQVAADVEGVLRGLEPDQARHLAVRLGVFVDHAERCAAVLWAREREREQGQEEEERRAQQLQQRRLQRRRRERDLRRHDAAAVAAATVSAMETEEAEEEEDQDLVAVEGVKVAEEAVLEGAAADGSSSRAGSSQADDETQSDGAHSRGGGGSGFFEEVFGTAHGRVMRMGRTLLAYSALRGATRLMSYMGSQLVDMGEPLGALPAASYNGIELLACSALSGCGTGVRIAAAWAGRGGTAISWRAQVSGQPAGVNLLHAVASLPLSLAVHTLDVLWSLATSAQQPLTAAEAFAAAWFAADGFDAPSVLFRAAASEAAAMAAADGGGIAADAVAAALPGLLTADNLDKLCLMRLASSYIRTHNYTSPLDNVDLPSMEANSCAALSGMGNTVRQTGVDAAAADAAAAVQDLDPGAAAAAVLWRGCSRSSGGGMTASQLSAGAAYGPDDGGGDIADRSGNDTVGGPWLSLYEPLAAPVASGARAAVLAAASMGTGGDAGRALAGLHPAVPALAASPHHMRVSVAPKALAQTTAAAAAASRHPCRSAGGSSWLVGGGSGADASCVPPSGTTNATTTLFPSGSLPVFASGMTAAGMTLYGSSLTSYYNRKPALPFEPLEDMFQPLPESPSSGGQGDSCPAATATAVASEPMSLPPPPLPGSLFGSGGGGAAAATVGMVAEVRCSGFGDATAAAAAAAAAADAEELFRLQFGASHHLDHHQQQHNQQHRQRRDQLAEIAAAAEGGAAAAAAAATVVSEPGTETLRDHMRGLARMFKRLFKKGREAPEGAGGPTERG